MDFVHVAYLLDDVMVPRCLLLVILALQLLLPVILRPRPFAEDLLQ